MKYSTEKSVQIIISLLKSHGIKRIIASPGSTNVCLVASLQNDDYFEMYSSVDERSAAYMACGLAAETGEPVVLTCTEATASRNYMSAMTEAFYRKLPILAITATNDRTLIGQNHPQMIDRSVTPRDIAKKSCYIPVLHSKKEETGYTVLLNDAILELTRSGGGPVHIEYETEYSTDYSVDTLPEVQVINRYTYGDVLPPLTGGNIAIYIGAHRSWPLELTAAVDAFCERYNAVVLTDHISNYHGKYGVYSTIVTSQAQYRYPCCSIDTLIYIGDISSAYKKHWQVKNSWRVNPDGEVRNAFGNLSCVFEMSEIAFFEQYSAASNATTDCSYFAEWRDICDNLLRRVPSLPFSNLWVAQKTAPLLPNGCRLFLGIENSLRSWNFFSKDDSVEGFCNTGGFGIDGGVSTLCGASLAQKDRLYFGVTGDLAFFYDMNALGNRHIGSNIRLLVVNNGLGQQFKNPGHPAGVLGDSSNLFVAAAGHYGDKSRTLLKNYAENLGYEYMTASTKEEFEALLGRFVDPCIGNSSIVFEVFTDTVEETEALRLISSIDVSTANSAKSTAKKLLGDSGVKIVKKFLR